MSAADRFTRIVALVAELTRAEARGEPAPTLAELARAHGVGERDIAADLRTLTLLGEHADADWLLSLSVWQQDDRVSITSAGPFRRPVRLSAEERLAVQVALALDPGGAPLARRFAALWAGRAAEASAPRGADPRAPDPGEDLATVVRRATRERRELLLRYAGEGDREARDWRLEPHQMAEYRGRVYLIAWAHDVAAWRHFRLDRALGAAIGERRFEPRADFAPMERPEDVFRPGGELDRVTVRFAPALARWVRDRYPDHEAQPDGSVLVRFQTANRDWLVRRVLEYGPGAEVVDPPGYRAAVRRAVG